METVPLYRQFGFFLIGPFYSQRCICENKKFHFPQIPSASGVYVLPEIPPPACQVISATSAKHDLTKLITVGVVSGGNYIPDRQIFLAIIGREKPMK